MPSPVPIEYLAPFPRPPSDFPKPDDAGFKDFAAQLTKETDALFAHPGWADQKTWHGGLAETSALAGSAVELTPPSKETAEDPAVQAQQKKNKALKGEDGLKKLADGLSFHQRSTVVDPSSQKEAEGLKYEHFWNALAKDHIQHEQTYVDNFREAVPVDGHHETYLKLYDLPFPTQNRSFLARLVVVNNPPDQDGLRSFAVYALPVIVDTQPEEKGHTRGRFVSVEEVKELEGGKLLWRCASMSTPGGSIPSKLSEGYAAGSMADAAPGFLKWLKQKVESTPGFDEAPEVAAAGGDGKAPAKEDASGGGADGGQEGSQAGTATKEAAPDAKAGGDAPQSSEDAAAGAVEKLSVQDDEAAAEDHRASSSTPAKSPAPSTPSSEGDKDEFVLAPEAPVDQLKQAAEPVPAAEPAPAPEAAAETLEAAASPPVGEDGLLPSMQGFEVLTAGGALGKPVAAH